MLLVLKVLLAPTLVVLSSVAARRWGPRAGGILVTIPIVAGPILLIIYLDHGPVFAAQAATAATAGNVALAVFALALIAVVDRVRWWLALLVAWACVLVTDLGLLLISVPAVVALVAALLALHGVQLVLRRQPVAAAVAPGLPWWDLPARAVATAALVLAVTGSAAALGPELSGVLAPFPIALSVVCAFAAAQSGRVGVIALLRGIVPGLDGFALFCFTVAKTIDRIPGWASFTLAALVNVAFAAFLIMIGDRDRHSGRRDRPASGPGLISGKRDARSAVPVRDRAVGGGRSEAGRQPGPLGGGEHQLVAERAAGARGDRALQGDSGALGAAGLTARTEGRDERHDEILKRAGGGDGRSSSSKPSGEPRPAGGLFPRTGRRASRSLPSWDAGTT